MEGERISGVAALQGLAMVEERRFKRRVNGQKKIRGFSPCGTDCCKETMSALHE